jgi:hypothetical protein
MVKNEAVADFLDDLKTMLKKLFTTVFVCVAAGAVAWLMFLWTETSLMAAFFAAVSLLVFAGGVMVLVLQLMGDVLFLIGMFVEVVDYLLTKQNKTVL